MVEIIEKERRKRDGLCGGGSCISQVIGKFLSRETLRLSSSGGSWEAGAGVSHFGKLCESLYPPLRGKLSRRSCSPQMVASCQSETVQQWVSRAVFWPKLIWITNQLLQPVPEAGNHHQLAGGIWSQGQTVLLLACCNVFAVARWEQWFFLQVLRMQVSLLPQAMGMMISWKKFKKKEEESAERCTAAPWRKAAFLQAVISWQNVFWNSKRHIRPKCYRSRVTEIANIFHQNKKIAFISHTVCLWTAWL